MLCAPGAEGLVFGRSVCDVIGCEAAPRIAHTVDVISEAHGFASGIIGAKDVAVAKLVL